MQSPSRSFTNLALQRLSELGILSQNERDNPWAGLSEETASLPQSEQLKWIESLNPSQLPRKYRRYAENRIYANRDTNLEDIHFYGFDMDYTLAVYQSPAYEELTYSLALHDLIYGAGYPEELLSLHYDPKFPIRGLLLDKQKGNLIKLDSFGAILLSVHGRKTHTREETRVEYPSLFIPSDQIGTRFFAIDTLFALPQACLFADLVDHFDHSFGHGLEDSKNSSKDAVISYSSLFQDMMHAMDNIHHDGLLKKKTLENLDHYVRRDERLSLLLKRLKERGKFCFLLTNSEWLYTDAVMKHILGHSWRHYFDLVIVGARKPSFFGEGTAMREVDLNSGRLKLSVIDIEQLKKNTLGKVFHGGNVEIFRQLTDSQGNDVLYIGDHIFSDVLVSKKSHQWRSLLVIRELNDEITSFVQTKDMRDKLHNLEWIRAEIYRGLDSDSSVPPDAKDLRQHISQTRLALDASYNVFFGSLFRTGTRPSYFSWQMQRYADLYTSDVVNLIHYPIFYVFSPGIVQPLPHEDQPEDKFAAMESSQ
ncbi:5' nucleotidase family protein [Galdieria sulphuraria]|uniref:5' nucleotidase family protein n=1 Tax=Galdieria sulphuraria TaxID=130081 RepID=M2XSH1_GALSU|nr:5' nucleotidase family protein [Galdieria sulphuraria]EME26349.1 5' nucleotidase family protein [Galdieria sulphuraria]|eukprot:XP_005702869.1 5' nucleotidase family protein [Galdieria sulphuraria]